MSEELNFDERREWAKLLYTVHNYNHKDLALAVSVDEATVRCWIREGGWEGMKRSALISKSTQLGHLYSILHKLGEKTKNTDELNLKEADLVLKYTAAIENLEGDTTIADIIAVFDPFMRWLRRKDKQLAKRIVVHLDAFIKERLAA